MIAVEVKQMGTRKSDGRNMVQALIVADSTPSPLPSTGENIIGLGAGDVFAPLSVLYVVANVTPKVYIANESGVFVGQKDA